MYLDLDLLVVDLCPPLVTRARVRDYTAVQMGSVLNCVLLKISPNENRFKKMPVRQNTTYPYCYISVPFTDLLRILDIHGAKYTKNQTPLTCFASLFYN